MGRFGTGSKLSGIFIATSAAIVALAGCEQGRGAGGAAADEPLTAERASLTSSVYGGQHFVHRPPANCHPRKKGNTCPVINQINSPSSFPLTASIGDSVTLTGVAKDKDGPAPLTYTWAATGGSLSATSGPTVQLICTTLGNVDVTLTVFDGDCADGAMVSVTCGWPQLPVKPIEPLSPIPNAPRICEIGFTSDSGATDGWLGLCDDGDADYDISFWVLHSTDNRGVVQTYTFPAGSIVPRGYSVWGNFGFIFGADGSLTLGPGGGGDFGVSWTLVPPWSYATWDTGPFVTTARHPRGTRHFPCNVGAATGDPHMRTFDGLQFDMQASGQFTLVHDDTDGLEIQIETAPWHGRPDVAINVAVEAFDAGTNLVFRRDTPTHVNVDVAGVPTELNNGSTSLLGGGRVIRTDASFAVVWPDGTELRVSPYDDSLDAIVVLSQSRLGRTSPGVVGLLGNANCNTADDLKTRDGSVTITDPQPSFTELYDALAPSWCVLPTGSLFDPSPDAPTMCTPPTRLATTDGLTPAQLATAVAACADQRVSADNPETADWLAACIMDEAFSEGFPTVVSPAMAKALAGLPRVSDKRPIACDADAQCGDGDPCNGVEVCDAAASKKCLAGTPPAHDPACAPRCTTDADCADANTCNGSERCDSVTGTCTNGSPLADGSPCNDGNVCTETDICQSGLCVGTNPVVCVAGTCHQAGACDPVLGCAANAPAPDGTPCSDNLVCTDGDHCQAGVCVGSPVTGTAVSPDPGPPAPLGPFASPIGVAASRNRLLVSEYCGPNVYYVDDQGKRSVFATLPVSSACSEKYLSTSPGLGGFGANDVFVSFGADVYRIDNEGHVSLFTSLPFSSLSGGVPSHVGVGFDKTGLFNYDMIVAGGVSGQVWRVDHTGVGTMIATFPGSIVEGPDVAPASFAPYAGHVLVASENANAVYAISPPPNYRIATVATWPGAESVHVIPDHVCSYGRTGAAFFSAIYPSAIYKYPSGDFTGRGGQVMVTSEGGSGIAILSSVGGAIVSAPFQPNVGQHEGSAFVDCTVPSTCDPCAGVVCPAAACHQAGQCDPTTGICLPGPAINCDDGNVCNGAEVCDPATNQCQPGALLNCDDHDPCTTDACDAIAGCTHSGGTPDGGTSIALYENDFEHPNTPITINCGNSLDGRGINFLYGSTDFTFTQTFTVEAVSTHDAQGLYSDPSGIGGNYAIGMLSTAENDMLGLTFQLQGKNNLNVGFDLSSIDVNGCGGPFGTTTPVMQLSLYDTPTGAFNFAAPGILLARTSVTGVPSPSGFTFAWAHRAVSLDATAASTGRVTLVFDLLQSGYAAFDNLSIAASNTLCAAQ